VANRDRRGTRGACQRRNGEGDQRRYCNKGTENRSHGGPQVTSSPRVRLTRGLHPVLTPSTTISEFLDSLRPDCPLPAEAAPTRQRHTRPRNAHLVAVPTTTPPTPPRGRTWAPVVGDSRHRAGAKSRQVHSRPTSTADLTHPGSRASGSRPRGGPCPPSAKPLRGGEGTRTLEPPDCQVTQCRRSPCRIVPHRRVLADPDDRLGDIRHCVQLRATLWDEFVGSNVGSP